MAENSSEVFRRWVSRLRSPAVTAGDLWACRAEVEPLSWGPTEAGSAAALSARIIELAEDEPLRAWGAWLGARAARFEARFPSASRLNALARRLYRALDDDSGLANCDLLAGAIATEVGDLAKADRSYRAAERRFTRLRDDRGIAACTYNRGLVHFRRAEYFEALQAFESAEAAFRTIGRESDAAICRMNEGNALDLMGRHQEALECFKASQAVFGSIGDDNRAARCRMNAGNALAAAGKKSGARKMYEEARDVFRRLGDDRMVAAALLNEAELDPQAAALHYREALEIFGRIEDKPGIGECELALAALEGSVERAEHALRLFRELGDRVRVAEAMRRLAAFAGNPIDLLEAALSSVEEAVAANPDFSFRFLAMRRFADLVPSLVMRHAKAGNREAAWHAGLRSSLRSGGCGPASDADSIQVQVDESGIVLLRSSDRGIDMEIVDVPRERVLTLVEGVDDEVRRPAGDSGLLRELGDVLLAPIFARRAPLPRLRILPGAHCARVPFAALGLAERTLIEQCALVIGDRAGRVDAPAAWDRGLVATRSEFEGPLLDLPATEREGNAVVCRLPSATHLHQRQATVSRVCGAVTESTFVHLATHALDAPANPSAASLVFEPDSHHPAGLLYGREIASLPVRSPLVVLSACGTDRQPESLAQAFLEAGAGTVLASGWRAHDDAAFLWMDAFYRELAEGAGVPEAHRRACLDLVGSRYADPHYWALWKLLG